MNLRDEILSAPRGTRARISKKTGLTRQAIYMLLHGKTRSPKTAEAIASAFGKPKRWAELLERVQGEPAPKSAA